MMPITEPWLFVQWRIDIMGPLLVRRNQFRFLIITIDYFTKCVEVERATTITEAKIASFIWKNIVCRFGTPNIIISDNGK